MRNIAFLIAILATFLGFYSTTTKAVSVSENRLIAAYVFNISKFIEWKGSAEAQKPNSKFKIAVVGNEALFKELSGFAVGKKLADREIDVFLTDELKGVESPAQVVVLISKGAGNLTPQLKALKGCQCLTVTYEEGMAQRGSVLNFFTEEDRLRFEVNLSRAKEESLDLSSQLLKLGRIIQ